MSMGDYYGDDEWFRGDDVSCVTMEERTYRWWILDGSGTAKIRCDANTENEVAHCMVEAQVSNGIPFGMGYRRFEMVHRQEL